MPSHPRKLRLLSSNFFLLWQGQLVSHVGSQAFAVATMFWAMETTGSAAAVGILMMLSVFPVVLISPIGGTIADWYPRRSIIIASDALAGCCVLSLGALMAFGPDDADSLMIALGLTILLVGTARAFFQPAVSALIPDLVPMEDVARANGMMQFTAQASAIVGQALGGLLYVAIGVPLLLLLDGLSYLFSAVSEVFIRIPQTGSRESASPRAAFASFLRDTSAGLTYVFGHPGMRAVLLTSSAVNFFIMPVVVLLPFYVEIQLGADASWYGYLLAGLGGGSIIGYVLAGLPSANGAGRTRVISASFFAAAVFIGLLGATSSRFAALALMAAAGISSGFINVQVITLFQTRTRPEMRGRAMSLLITISSAVVPFGMLIGGILGDVTGRNLSAIFLGSGGCAAVAALLAALNRDFRSFLGSPPIPEPDERREDVVA